MLKVFGVVLVAAVLYWYLAHEELTPSALKGQRVLITGASSGIGEQLAYHYCRLGASVVITARRQELLKNVLAKCKSESDGTQQHNALTADLSKPGNATDIVKETVRLLGGLDQLIINHARLVPGRPFQGSKDDLTLTRDVMDANFHSCLELTGAALKDLEKTNGSIGVVSSMTAKLPSAGVFILPYVASKAALAHFYEGFRQEIHMSKKNVSITIAHIGLTDTEQARTGFDSLSKLGLKMDEILKMAAPAKPEDSAYAILKATTLRQQEVYFPQGTKYYIMSILRALSPKIINTIEEYSGLHELTTENSHHR